MYGMRHTSIVGPYKAVTRLRTWGEYRRGSGVDRRATAILWAALGRCAIVVRPFRGTIWESGGRGAVGWRGSGAAFGRLQMGRRWERRSPANGAQMGCGFGRETCGGRARFVTESVPELRRVLPAREILVDLLEAIDHAAGRTGWSGDLHEFMIIWWRTVRGNPRPA